ncbi:MAG TPA: sulfurtransferase [Nitrococcus sp.]|nr:sulfurtransferase [Nitrococcus sp.]
MSWSTLIPVKALAEHLGHPEWVVVDCRFDLTDGEAGRRAYTLAHIPGAHYAHLDEDLAGPITEHSGRHPLPDPATFVHWLERKGIGNTSQVVAYDAGPGAIAARLWWLLRWLGHEAVAVLDGGFLAWQSLGYPISRDHPRPRPAHFQGQPGAMPAIDTATLSRGLERYRIVDARVGERFRGDVEPIDAVAGHIPGALNRPFPANLGPSGGFLDRQSLQAAWCELLPVAGAPALVAMCGSGVTACHHILALEHAGWHGAQLYSGSWSEWIRDPARPVARGDACGRAV